MLLVSHWMSCPCFVFPFEEQTSPNFRSSKYIGAIYWAMQTITTVGYGDMVPTADGGPSSRSPLAIGGLILAGSSSMCLGLGSRHVRTKQQARIDRMMAFGATDYLPSCPAVVRHVRQQNSRQTEDRAVLTGYLTITFRHLPAPLRGMLSVPLFLTRESYTHTARLDVCTKVIPLTIP